MNWLSKWIHGGSVAYASVAPLATLVPIICAQVLAIMAR
jgi:hypothetical protein